MGLSDCIHCWNTPCTCGWDYRDSKIEYLQEKIILLQYIINFKKANPDAVFSNYTNKETEDDAKFLAYMRPLLIAQNEACTKRIKERS
jgi:hypothetical protein